MGYPLTFQRLLNRNNLQDVDYGSKLSGVNTGPGRTMLDVTAADFNEGVDFVHLLKKDIKLLYQEIDRVNQKWSMLCGDIKRLQKDAVDEAAICNHIAHETGLNVEMVAAVLKAWMEW